MLDQMSHLLRLQSIVDLGSMRQAANRLNVTQPALSRPIAKLEKKFGRPLLIRSSRGVEPTEFGRLVLGSINRLSRHWELSEASLMRSGEEITGRFRFLAGPLWRAIVLPSILGDLHKSFPSLVFEIQNSSHSSNFDEIVEGRCDVMFGSVEGSNNLDKRLEHQEFASFCDSIVAREVHPIFSKINTIGEIPLAEVLNYPWIVYTADPVYEKASVYGTIERLGQMPDIKIEAESLIAVINLLQSNDYLCILPEATLEHLDGPRLLPLPIDLGRRQIASGAVYRQEMADWPPLIRMMDLCSNFFTPKAGSRRSN